MLLTNKKKSSQTPTATMSNDVEFAVRGPLPATWGSDEDHRSRPGSCILDLLFSSPNKVGELVFRNYYTAWVTILIRTAANQSCPVGSKSSVSCRGVSTSRVDAEGHPSSWKVAIPRRVLMPYPHQETGSHDVISIAATESLVEWNNLLAMRLLLQQPSPVWRTFHVEEISVMRDVPRRVPVSKIASPGVSAASQIFTKYCPASATDSRLDVLRDQTLVALRKSNAPEREGPPPKDFVGLVGYEVQGLITL